MVVMIGRWGVTCVKCEGTGGCGPAVVITSVPAAQYSSVYCVYFMYGFTLQSPHCTQRRTRQCIVLISCMASLFSPRVAFNAGLVSVFHAGQYSSVTSLRVTQYWFIWCRAILSSHLIAFNAVLVSVLCLFHVWLHSSVPSLHSTHDSSVYFMQGNAHLSLRFM